MAEDDLDDDDFNPRVLPEPPVATTTLVDTIKPIATVKPTATATVKCRICGRVGNWSLMQSPSYTLSCFDCDIDRGIKNITINNYQNDIRCGVVKNGVQCGRHGCQRWVSRYPVCTTCNPPPKPQRKRIPLTVSFKAAWLDPNDKVPDRPSSNLGRFDRILLDRLLPLRLHDGIEKLESAIVQREDTGDAKVITNFAVTVADLWEDAPAKITMVLHKRKG